MGAVTPPESPLPPHTSLRGFSSGGYSALRWARICLGRFYKCPLSWQHGDNLKAKKDSIFAAKRQSLLPGMGQPLHPQTLVAGPLSGSLLVLVQTEDRTWSDVQQ